MALKHTLENKETIVSEGSHMLDSTVKSDLVTLDTDETHAGGGIRNREDFGLDKVTGHRISDHDFFLSQIDY